MAKTVTATTTIAAPPATVWDLLTDAGGYTRWNPSILALQGAIEDGRKIQLKAAVNPSMTFHLKVGLEPTTRMTWKGGMPLGLFKGEREFVLTPVEGGTRFDMTEVFSGPMLPLIWATMPDLQPSFDEFAASLKKAAEAKATS